MLSHGKPFQSDFRVRRPNGEIRWFVGTAIATVDNAGRTLRITGVTVDITERKHAEERQLLLAQEVDHRAKNALTLVQSILRLTRAYDSLAFALAGCRSRRAHRRGIRPLHLRRLRAGPGRWTQSIS